MSKKPVNNPTFEERLEIARAEASNRIHSQRIKSDIAIDYELKKDSITVLTTILNSIYESIGMDTEKLNRSIKLARRSEYGRIAEMITMVSKIYAWPIEDISNAKEIDNIQADIIDHLASIGIQMNHDLLMDIKEAKGNHSFLTKDTFEIVDSVEPEYDELGFYLQTFAEYSGLPIVDYKLSEEIWMRNEAKAQVRIQAEHEAAQAALDAHKALESA